MPMCPTHVGGWAVARPTAWAGPKHAPGDVCSLSRNGRDVVPFHIRVCPYVFLHVCRSVGLSCLPYRQEALSHTPAGTLGR